MSEIHSETQNPNSSDEAQKETASGEVVKLDRKFPLVELFDGQRIRCEHSAALKKGGSLRAVIGDLVEVAIPDGHDLGMIEAIAPRKTSLVRKDPVDRVVAQTLAANFDQVVIVHPIDRLNPKRLERELVLAHETGADVVVVLSKSDLVGDDVLQKRTEDVKALAGADVLVQATSSSDPESVAKLREVLGAATTSILLGSSGAGKSTLINRLLGKDVQAVSDVRESDGKGRHTTVSREILELPNDDPSRRAPRIVDMPGVRGLGLWEAQEGIETAFTDIEELANSCRFRDCKHGSEPGCAVRDAVESGDLSEARLQSYLDLRDELEQTNKRRERAAWKNK